LSGWVGATRRTQVNADPHLDAPSPTDNRFNDLRSALSVPIERSSELAGVLTIYARDPNRFTPADASAAELVARVLAQPGVMPQATSRSG
jgi:GAF domain-containing protein